MAMSEVALGGHLQSVRELALELAHEDINHDLRELQQGRGDLEEEDTGRIEENILRKLKRLSPGEVCSIGSVIDDAGNISGDPDEMARILRDHWSKVFGPSGCDAQLLRN